MFFSLFSWVKFLFVGCCCFPLFSSLTVLSLLSCLFFLIAWIVKESLKTVQSPSLLENLQFGSAATFFGSFWP